MGYQSRQTYTVATLDSISSSNGTSSRTAQTGNSMDADKENTISSHGRYPFRSKTAVKDQLILGENTNSSHGRYPLRSKTAVKDQPTFGENGGPGSKSRKNPTSKKRPKCSSSNPRKNGVARKRRGVQIKDGCIENHNVKTAERSDGNTVLADPVAVHCNGQDNDRSGSSNKNLPCRDEERALALNDAHNALDQSSASLISKIQEIYSKLHLKYRRLKELKFGEVEKYIEEQNRNLIAYVQAQHDLLEHIRTENNLLKLHADQPNITMTLNRLKFLQQENIECQSHLVDQHTKNKELRNEVSRLESLLSDHVEASNKIQIFCAVCQSCKAHCLDTEEHVSISQDIHLKNQCDTLAPYHADLESNLKNQCNTVQKESLQYSCRDCDCNTRVDNRNQERKLVCGKIIDASDKNIQPDMKVGLVKSSSCGHQVRKDAWEGEETNMAVGRVNSLEKVLLQRIVGFKITVVDEGESPKLVFLHQSSGYSFQLKCANHDNYLSENGELAYQVISFGTLGKVTPDWMKEEIIFNVAQVDVFFDRLLHVVNGRGYQLGLRR